MHCANMKTLEFGSHRHKLILQGPSPQSSALPYLGRHSSYTCLHSRSASHLLSWTIRRCKSRSSTHVLTSFTTCLNHLTPNDTYMGRTAPLTSKLCILYIYSTNVGTKHFKHAVYSPFFFSSKYSLFHNANLFGFCIIHILYKGCAKITKIIPAPKG